MIRTTITDEYRPLLRKAGLKATPERIAILDVLNKSKIPLSVKGVANELKDSKVNQATVYRTIDALIAKDIVRPVNFRHDHNHYELAGQHHHHLICEQCGKVVDVSKCDTAKLEQAVRKVGGFAQVNSHALEFFGLCKACAQKNK